MVAHPDTKKAEMLDALYKHRGIVSTAAREIGIHRDVHYDWLKSDTEYANRVNQVKESITDFLEKKLFERIEEGDADTLLIFALKCLGKTRGYVDRGPEDATTVRLVIEHQHNQA